MTTLKRGWIVAAAIVGVLFVGVVFIQHMLNANTYRSRIETVLSGSLGRNVQLGNLSFSLLTGSLVAEAPSIADDPAFNTQPFLTAADVHIGVATAALLFHHELHITSFTINQPKITLLRAANGSWNYSSIGQDGKRKAPTAETSSLMPNLMVGKVEVTDGTVTLGTFPESTSRVYNSVNISAQNFTFAAPFPFTLSASLPAGGTLQLSGYAGPIDTHDASLTPLDAQTKLKNADLLSAGLVTAQQGVSGIADLDVRLVSNGHHAQGNGKLHLTQLKLAKNGSPSPVPVDAQFALDQDLQALSGKINNANVQIGKASAGLSGTYQTSGNITTLHLEAIGQNMPIDELVSFIPSLGINLPSGARLQGGSLTSDLKIDGPTTAIVVSGPVRIAHTQLAGFDLGQKLSVIQLLTGAKTGPTTTIEALSTNLRYGPEGTRTENLSAVVAGIGSASGDGSIRPGGGLDYQLTVKLKTGGFGNIGAQALTLLPEAFGAVLGQGARDGIPVTVGGTTANPTFTPDFGRLAGRTLRPKALSADPIGNLLGGLLRH